LVWSVTFLIDVGLTDLGDFGRYWGQNKAIAGVFNGSVVSCHVETVHIFLARVVVIVKILNFGDLEKKKWPLNTVDILLPEVNVSS
jgi:hypothetical protein